jgi:hypothetical protein
VVHNLGVLAVPAQVRSCADLILAVLAYADVARRRAALYPDGNMLPVVGVAWVWEIRKRDILLKVVAIRKGQSFK